MKLSKEKIFILIPNGYDFLIWFVADYETEKSFGKRGVSLDCVRYRRSTGEMYSKSNCVWKSFENENDANIFYNNLKEYTKKIDSLKNDIQNELLELKNQFKNEN